MKRLLFILALGFWLLAPVMSQPQVGHYTLLDGKSGEALFQAISTCAAQGHKRVGYDKLWTAFGTTDLRADGTVWDMYSNCTFVFGVVEGQNGQCTGGTMAECGCYNREHSIPKSWWGNHTTPNQYTDLFHLIPADANVNTIRNNNPYGEVAVASNTTGNGSKYGTCTFPGYTGKAFEPIDEYKGDLARGVLGTITHYQGAWTEQDGAVVFTGVYTQEGNFGLTDYALNLFLKWHRNDPVSQKELDRNNGIEKTQGNRNPFIDYPELVEYIWGNKQGRKLTLGDICSAYEKDCVPSDEAGKDDEEDKGNKEEEITGDYYYKLMADLDDYAGTYLIVYESDSVVFDGQSETLASANTLAVAIQNGIILSTSEVDAASFVIAPMTGGYSVCTQDGRFIKAGSGTSNTVVVHKDGAYLHTISIDAESNASLICTTDEDRFLRYNATSNSLFFRYYKVTTTNKSLKPIQLYKKHVRDTSGGVTTDLAQPHISAQGNLLVCQSSVPTDVWIYDYTGRLVLHQSNVTRLAHTLSSGIYLVKMGTTTQKIRVNK